MRMRVTVLLLSAVGLSGQQQPVPYSHKLHLEMGLECKLCHQNADPGEMMGYPAVSVCMDCHQDTRTDSPHIQKLAAAAKSGKPIEWVRVYRLPAFVYFSHRVHAQAGAACETCHGPVRDRSVITKEVTHSMRFCMTCHTASKARNECNTCHEER